MLLLGLEHDYFSRVISILVHRSSFQSQERRPLGSVELVQDKVNLAGLAHYRGVVVLVWRDVRRAGRRPHGGENSSGTSSPINSTCLTERWTACLRSNRPIRPPAGRR